MGSILPCFASMDLDLEKNIGRPEAMPKFSGARAICIKISGFRPRRGGVRVIIGSEKHQTLPFSYIQGLIISAKKHIFACQKLDKG